jgi:hypothetical protein
MDLCSEKVVEKYLLYKNPLYAFRFPIALLVGIFLFGYFEMKKVSDNSYINQILIPIASILFVMVIIDMVCRTMISSSEKDRLMKLCKLFKAHPLMKGKAMDMNVIDKYDGKLDGYVQQENSQVHPQLEIQELNLKKIKMIPDMSRPIPQTMEGEEEEKEEVEGFSNQEMRSRPQVAQPMDIPMNQMMFEPKDDQMFNVEVPRNLPSKKYQGMCIQPSDCCNLCSGSNDNPCNVVTAIPGPQWMPKTAMAKQEELKNGIYTPGRCLL